MTDESCPRCGTVEPVMSFRSMTAIERQPDNGIDDYVIFEMNMLHMQVALAPGIARKIEDLVNLELGRDAVRVEPKILVY